MWWTEFDEQQQSVIILETDEGSCFYNSHEVAVIEAPVNKLKEEE